jgi:hypothetical protein
METFRIMTQSQHMGAVLVGKGPSDKHSETSNMFFNAIKELVDSVGNENFGTTQKRIRTTIMEHVDKMESLQVLTFLRSAIDNYLQQTHEHIKEAIGDNTYEYNVCSVCKWEGSDYFYYSTIYGLNMPVCSLCVEEKEKKEFEEKEFEEKEFDEEVSDEDDEEYVPSDEDDEEASDEEDEEDEDDEEATDEEDEDDEEDEEEEDEEDEDLYNDDPHCEPEKFFGCEGCQYEWRDGWQEGWKAAMKQIKKFAKQQKRPENIRIPECHYCGASHNLKKCGGSCEGAVRYCSIACQKKDWNEEHKHDCCAKQ